MIWINLLIWKKHFLFDWLKEKLLRKTGSKLIKNGYTKDIEKLIKVFIIRNIWVFWKTAQNADK